MNRLISHAALGLCIAAELSACGKQSSQAQKPG